MKLKTVTVGDKTYAEVLDGKPIYVHDDGKEAPFDVPDMYAKILRDGKSVGELRKNIGELETKLKAFDGIDDPPAYIKAMEITKNLDEGKLLTLGKVEEAKAGMKKAFEEQFAAAIKASGEENAKSKSEIERLNAELDQNVIGGGFARSKLITDPKHPTALIMTANVAKAYFGKNFKREDGKVVGYDNNGNKLFSRAKPGELADMDEALELLVAQDPDKDQILRGSGNKGDGARGSNGAGGSGQKTIPRAEFDKLDPAAQMKVAVGKDAMKVVD